MDAFTLSIPRLRTAKLRLREYRQSDFADFAAFFQTDRARFIGGPVTPDLAWRGLAAQLGH
jgi:ribosomal-protein-alanine N-acetyltransferase